MTLVLTTHYMDEAEQLCDRLVVMDKAKIVAEGSPRQLIERYSTKEVTELRFPVGVQETLDGQLDGIGDRIERLPDRILVYSDDGEAAAAAAHQRGLVPETVLVRRSSLEDVFLQPHRPHARRLMAVSDAPYRLGSSADLPRRSALAGLAAAYEHMWLLYRRTWRGSIFSSFVQPALFLLAMGVGLGGFVDKASPDALGGVPYLQWLAPALMVSTVMQGSVFEATFPVIGGFNWVKRYHAMYATPLTPVRDRVRPARLGRDAGDDGGVDLRPGHRAVRGGGDRRDRAGDPGRGADGPRVRRPGRGVHVDPARHDARSTPSGGSGSRRCSCSRARSSRSSGCPTSSSRSPGSCPCGTASTWAGRWRSGRWRSSRCSWPRTS